VSDWYWPAFGRFCVEHELLVNPCCDDRLRDEFGLPENVDRGGGFATPLDHHEVLDSTRQVHWTPGTREPWNGFRAARDEKP
jgi:hypothetical protein